MPIRYLLRTLLLLTLAGCVDEYDAFTPLFSTTYIQVEGALSNLPDGRTLTLQTLISPSRLNTVTQPITNARVTIRIDDAATITVPERRPGRYELPATLFFQPGHTYQLTAALPDGRTLTSTPETMPMPVPIRALRGEFTPDRVTPANGITPTAGHLIYGDFDDPAGERNYYRFNWKSWERQFHCKRCVNSVLYAPGDTVCTSQYNQRLGYVRIDPTTRRPIDFYFDYQCGTECWQQLFNPRISVLSDEQVNGRSIRNALMADIPLLEPSSFLIECQLESITRSYYTYLKGLEDQVKLSGGIADTPPAPIRGNVTVGTGEPTVGYFTVVGVATQRLFVERQTVNFQRYPIAGLLGRKPYVLEPDRPGALPPHPPVPLYPCNPNEEGFRTPVKPAGWPN